MLGHTRRAYRLISLAAQDPSHFESISIYRVIQDISIYADLTLMLEGLILTDSKGRKYKLVLINDETAQPPAKGPSGQTIGEWIKRERLKLKLTQAGLANAIGTQQPNIVAYEKNRREPSPENLKKLNDLFSKNKK